MQPINYLQNVADPFAQVLSGLKIGATMADMDAARETQRLAAEKQQAELQRINQYQTGVNKVLANPNRTWSDWEPLLAIAPNKDQIEAIKLMGDRGDARVKKSQQNFVANVLLSLEQNPEFSKEILDERIQAEPDPQQKQLYQTIRKAVDISPEKAAQITELGGAALFGEDWYKGIVNVRQERRAAAEAPSKLKEAKAKAIEAEAKAKGAVGKTISSEADKRAAGLINAKTGEVLSGTYFVKEGEEPKLVKGEEDAKPAPPSEVMRLFGEIATLEANGAPKNDPRILALRDKIKKETQFAPVAPGAVIKLTPQESAERGERGKMLVTQYKDISDSAKLAAKTLPSIDANLGILNEGFDTGFGTPTKAAAAKVLSALGVDNAEKFAAKAEIFQAKASEMVLQKQLDQKGPQTESDARRLEQTISQLGNTKKGNQFLLATAKEQLKRDIEQRNFYDKWWKQNNTYDGAEDAWYAGDGGKSLFDRPALRAFVPKESFATQIPTTKSVTPTQPIVDRRQPTPTGVRRQIAPGVFVTERP